MEIKNIFVAGHNGMVGSALIRQLSTEKKNNVVVADKSELDLTNQYKVNRFFKDNNIDEVYLAAAKVGGIYANNKYPADFIYQNLMIELNIIDASHKADINKLLFLGSSCIYPKYAQQPMKEDALLSGAFESTNEPYAIAKIAGIKLCESYNRQHGRDYRSVMPSNLYGPGDNYHPKNSHVIPGLIRRFHDASLENLPEVYAWGTGEPMREFLYVDDMADASIFIMNINKSIYDKVTEPMISHINIGSGIDISIKELTEIIAEITNYKGNIIWDDSKPDGPKKKLMDVSKLSSLGWSNKIDLKHGLKMAYNDYLLGFRG
jgi:GDP-L-fucose synthase